MQNVNKTNLRHLFAAEDHVGTLQLLLFILQLLECVEWSVGGRHAVHQLKKKITMKNVAKM